MNENENSIELGMLRSRLILSIQNAIHAGGSATEVTRCIESLMEAKIEEALRRQAQERIQR